MKRFFSALMVAILCLPLCPLSALAAGEAGTVLTDYTPLYTLTENHGFKMGGCFSYNQLNDQKYLDFMKQHFNSITCTNETKAYSLLNQTISKLSDDGTPGMIYVKADKMVQWAQDNGLKVRGHVLVWDAHMNDWFFREDYDSNKPYADKETMRARVKSYIEQVITHFEEKFPGVIYCWDVVNEAIGDNMSESDYSDARHLRTVRSGVDNLFKTHVGDDYVEYAFLCAKDTVEKLGSDIKLFYNDYNMFYRDKQTAALALIDSINSYAKDENGNYRQLIDGLGMQGYIGGYGSQNGCLDKNHPLMIKNAIRAFAAKGVEVQITEMAVRNFDASEATVQRHAEFYAELFKVFKEVNSGDEKPLTCVAVWGVSDNPNASGYTYNMNGTHSGLITENYEIKTSFHLVHEEMSK